MQSASGENYIIANDTGSVDISFDNSKKLETTSGGLKVTGITTLTNRLHVEAGISTFDADVRFGIGATVGFGTSAFFKDDAAIYLGDDSDLRIYSDGSTSYLKANDLRLQSLTGESYITNTANGAVVLFYDNSNKLATTSGGLNVTGITTFSDRINVVSGVSTFQDDAKLTFGAQADLEVFSDGSTSFLRSNDLRLRSLSGENYITNTANGAVSLFYDNGSVLQTTPQGINVSGVTTSNRLNISGISTFTGLIDANGGAHIDNLRLGIDADNDITTSSGNLTLDSTGGTVEVNDNLQVDGQTDLNGDINLGDATSETITATARFDSDLIPATDGNKNLGSSTLEWGDLHLDGTANIDTLDVDATSNFADDVTLVAAGSSTILFDASAHKLVFQDNIRANFGTSEDLSIFHDGLNSFIRDSGTGNLKILSNHFIVENAAGEENILQGEENGPVKLFYDNSNKVETTSGGLKVTGNTTISD